ncbi:MAG: bifunctional nuclease family protein [Treponema sp.]|nr:bifunctional nuclease family protein [Treponema sp.]
MEKLMLTEIWTIAQTNHGNVVFLRPKETDIAVPVIIGQLELHSILIGKEGVIPPRPLTHDLLLNIIKRLGIKLRQIEIHSLIDDTFHARLILEGRDYSADKPLIMDSRPSDAIALAVRKKCPIYITAELVKKAGIPLDYFIDEIEKTASGETNGDSKQNNQYQNLIRQLNQAVEAEEYERAAEIRDMLIQMGDLGSGE